MGMLGECKECLAHSMLGEEPMAEWQRTSQGIGENTWDTEPRNASAIMESRLHGSYQYNAFMC